MTKQGIIKALNLLDQLLYRIGSDNYGHFKQRAYLMMTGNIVNDQKAIKEGATI